MPLPTGRRWSPHSRRLDPPDVRAARRGLLSAPPLRCAVSLPSQPHCGGACRSRRRNRRGARRRRESWRGSQPGKHHVPLDLLASSILRAKNQPPHQIHRNRCLMETRCTTGFPIGSLVWEHEPSPSPRETTERPSPSCSEGLFAKVSAHSHRRLEDARCTFLRVRCTFLRVCLLREKVWILIL